jgi:hypothetical protein
VQTLVQLLPGALLLASPQPMFIYQPNIYSNDRVVWYGGESTQLHYETESIDEHGNPKWIDRTVRTLGCGIPSGVSELQAELVDYYNYCQCMELVNV